VDRLIFFRKRCGWCPGRAHAHDQLQGKKTAEAVEAPGLYSIADQVSGHPSMRLTTMAAMPASPALAIGDDSMSPIGFDP
jgi:hypothetical protein